MTLHESNRLRRSIEAETHGPDIHDLAADFALRGAVEEDGSRAYVVIEVAHSGTVRTSTTSPTALDDAAVTLQEMAKALRERRAPQATETPAAKEEAGDSSPPSPPLPPASVRELRSQMLDAMASIRPHGVAVAAMADRHKNGMLGGWIETSDLEFHGAICRAFGDLVEGWNAQSASHWRTMTDEDASAPVYVARLAVDELEAEKRLPARR